MGVLQVPDDRLRPEWDELNAAFTALSNMPDYLHSSTATMDQKRMRVAAEHRYHEARIKVADKTRNISDDELASLGVTIR